MPYIALPRKDTEGYLCWSDLLATSTQWAYREIGVHGHHYHAWIELYEMKIGLDDRIMNNTLGDEDGSPLPDISWVPKKSLVFGAAGREEMP